MKNCLWRGFTNHLNADSLAALVEAGSDLAARKVACWRRAASAATVVPGDTTLVPLPRYAPELNSAGNIWEFLRKNKLTKTVFDSDDDIVDKACRGLALLRGRKSLRHRNHNHNQRMGNGQSIRPLVQDPANL